MNPAIGSSMPASRKPVTVIGGGVVGMLCAWTLLKEGFAVSVLERDPADAGCSTGNAGSVSAGSVAPIGMPGMWRQVPAWMLDPDGPFHIQANSLFSVLPWLVRFLRQSSAPRVEKISHGLKALMAPSIDLYQRIVQDLGAGILLQTTGQLQLYRSAKARRADSAVWNLRRARGVQVNEVGAGEIRDLEPAISAAYTHGIWLPNEGTILNPGRLVQSIREDFVRHGGLLKPCTVRGFEIGAAGPRCVHTDQGAIPVDNVLIAAGAWSHLLASQLGSHVPLQTQRGYHVTLPDSGITLKRTVVATDKKIFVTSMEMGLRIAGTVEFGNLDSPPNFRRALALIDHGKGLLPALNAEPYSKWMGNRPCLPDSLPVIGPSQHYPSVVYAFGHGHLGLTGAPMTAQIVKDAFLGRKPSVDLTPYRVDRF
jgi:D-amino-acid dehydrogenase